MSIELQNAITNHLALYPGDRDSERTHRAQCFAVAHLAGQIGLTDIDAVKTIVDGLRDVGVLPIYPESRMVNGFFLPWCSLADVAVAMRARN